MTPDQITAACQRLARLIDRYESRSAITGANHCDVMMNRDDADALALAQQALREWVPRSEREHIATVLVKYLGWAEARRLLKLEDTPDGD